MFRRRREKVEVAVGGRWCESGRGREREESLLHALLAQPRIRDAPRGERWGQDYGWHKLSSKDKELCKLVRCKVIIRSGTR